MHFLSIEENISLPFKYHKVYFFRWPVYLYGFGRSVKERSCHHHVWVQLCNFVLNKRFDSSAYEKTLKFKNYPTPHRKVSLWNTRIAFDINVYFFIWQIKIIFNVNAVLWKTLWTTYISLKFLKAKLNFKTCSLTFVIHHFFLQIIA